MVKCLILSFIKYLKQAKLQDTISYDGNHPTLAPRTLSLTLPPGTPWVRGRGGWGGALRTVSGFTLIELLVVIIIIGLLAALVGPKLFGRVGKGKQAAAQAQIELFGAALDNFRLDIGRYPASEEGLKALLANPGAISNWDGPYLKKQEIPVDPWGHPYVYKAPGEHGDYDIISHGGDGVAGGDGENQDIVSWKGIKPAGERVEQ